MRLKETDIHGLTNTSARSLKCWVNIGDVLLGKRARSIVAYGARMGTISHNGLEVFRLCDI
ncbi:hypothetical protein CY34DRAFT_807518 [Suillus luteus UH-Slu-Lm8-n1]|uniref:Uncharacterized protein n=1 Tax=Suillus luteus UH-Slu-Lm8-n1 TaxID=930992 RepID=A0A0D0B0S1_9AGAM|nr:hypothetical protein CY34DRAFT_807518 [Suillus luteus UH-Slu-Lm8-n1]